MNVRVRFLIQDAWRGGGRLGPAAPPSRAAALLLCSVAACTSQALARMPNWQNWGWVLGIFVWFCCFSVTPCRVMAERVPSFGWGG